MKQITVTLHEGAPSPGKDFIVFMKPGDRRGPIPCHVAWNKLVDIQTENLVLGERDEVWWYISFIEIEDVVATVLE